MQEVAQQNCKQWEVYESMPNGFRITKDVGSPRAGYAVATNGSLLRGGRTVLVRVTGGNTNTNTNTTSDHTQKNARSNNGWSTYEAVHSKKVNELARAKAKEKMLKDISADLMVCKLEGWSQREYLDDLKCLFRGLGNKKPTPPNSHQYQLGIFDVHQS